MIPDNFDTSGLPQYDANAALQARSVKALNALLKAVDTLVIRDERHSDFGVDASLEVILKGRATNFRAQIQIKAITNARVGLQGLISLSVPVYNVNYLLNGPCPLYILYLADSDEFYFLWLHDERRRLDKQNHTWTSQQTITLHFSRKLDNSAIDAIARRILDEEFLRKQLMHRLMMRTLGGSIKVWLDPTTLQAIDGGTAYEIVTRHGFNLISGGLVSKVLELIDLLDVGRKQQAQIQLISAYACFIQGQFQKASAFLGEASAKRRDLSADDLRALGQMQDICDVQIGRISREEYTKRLAMASKHTTGDEALVNALERARYDYLAARNATQRQALLQQLRDAAQSVARSNSIGAPLRLQARIYFAFAEGTDLSLKITHEIGMQAIRRDIKQDWAPPDDSDLARAIRELLLWNKRIDELISEASEAAIPYLRAEAIRTRLVIRAFRLSSERFKSHFMKIGSGPSRAAILEAKEDARAAIEGFITANHQEGELRARLELAEVHEIADEVDDAKCIAAEVLPIAEALGLVEIARQAKAFLTGNTIFNEFEREAQFQATIDNDFGWADMDVGSIEHFARAALEASRLPQDRLPVMIRETESLKAAATERLHWCRHLVLIQNLLHSQHQLTAYATDPIRFARCEKHRYESVKGSTDFVAVLSNFKRVFCSDCPDRDPKKPPN